MICLINALILSGGQSHRMGQPKALLPYLGQPQIFRLAQMLAPFCDGIYLSCQSEQQSLFKDAGWTWPVITDEPSLGDIGPINGLLSAFKTQTAAWLVVGCDYPLLTTTDFQELISMRDQDCLATVFRHPETGFAEPLIGIYEPAAGAALVSWLGEGNQSLRWFLEKHHTHFVVPSFPDHLKSVDTKEDYADLIQ
jgi:molybdopterin-guanine dinucleotide biosynthesis protein A